MNEPTTYTIKELNTMARLQAKQAAEKCGFRLARAIEWKLRISDTCTSLLISYSCEHRDRWETSIVI